jgi:basic membrane protein A
MKCTQFFLNLVFLLSSFPSFSATRVALVLDRAGKEDRSFNAAAYLGATRAQKELGIELKHVEASDVASFESLHRSLAGKKFDLIIGIGFSQLDAVKKIASQNPQQKFAIVDGDIQAPNVRSLLFEEHEGSFLVGAAAALKSKSKKIGFIGGMDIPLIRRFEKGFVAGVKHIQPAASVTVNYIGSTSDAFNNPTKGKELALSQLSAGVDVIFVAAGSSGLGVFDAAEEKKALAIGVDSNQNWIKPGFILTSMLKRVDVAVFETIKDCVENKFSAGVQRFGLSNKGIDYALDEHNSRLLTKEIQSKLEEIKKQILSKKIKVPDFYKNE